MPLWIKIEAVPVLRLLGIKNPRPEPWVGHRTGYSWLSSINEALPPMAVRLIERVRSVMKRRQ